MGHVRLGTLPLTRQWREVVRLIADGADIAQVSDVTLAAADQAFARMPVDVGFNEAVWLLTQLGLNPKTADLAKHLESLGIALSAQTSIAEVASTFKSVLAERTLRQGRASDIGVIASNALVAAITTHLDKHLGGLFEASAEEVKRALGNFGSQKNFGELSKTFFGRLMRDSLQYFLDKTIDTHLGDGQRFQTRNSSREFRKALSTHCDEASEIITKFAGEWISKNRFLGGGEIRRDKTAGFGWYAMEKIRAEMKQRGKTDE